MDFLQSDFSASDFNKSGVKEKIGAEVTAKLSISQKKTLYETLKKYKNSSNPLGKALGELDLNKNDGISSNTANKIRQAAGVKFDRSAYRNQKNTSLSQNKSPYVSAPRQPIAPIQHSTSGSQLSQTFVNRTSNTINSGLIVKR